MQKTDWKLKAEIRDKMLVTWFDCRADRNGNRPCDNGVYCDRCHADTVFEENCNRQYTEEINRREETDLERLAKAVGEQILKNKEEQKLKCYIQEYFAQVPHKYETINNSPFMCAGVNCTDCIFYAIADNDILNPCEGAKFRNAKLEPWVIDQVTAWKKRQENKKTQEQIERYCNDDIFSMLERCDRANNQEERPKKPVATKYSSHISMTYEEYMNVPRDIIEKNLSRLLMKELMQDGKIIFIEKTEQETDTVIVSAEIIIIEKEEK